MHRDEARARRRRHAFAVVDACPTTNLPTHHSCPRTPPHAQASGGREEGLLQADATPRQEGVLALKNVTPQGDRDAELRTCPPHSSPLALLRHGKPHSNAEHSRRGRFAGLGADAPYLAVLLRWRVRCRVDGARSALLCPPPRTFTCERFDNGGLGVSGGPLPGVV